MLNVGTISYAGEDYYIHIATNGSKVRYLLFSPYSSEVRERLELVTDEEELEELRKRRLEVGALNKAMVNKMHDYLIGGFQSDRKLKKAHYIGDIHILDIFIKNFESVMNTDYSEKEESVVSVEENKSVEYIDKDTLVKYVQVRFFGEIEKDYKSQMEFNINDMYYICTFENGKNAHAAPFKDWEWKEDIDFDTSSMRRHIISLQAKTLSQLKQEKDLSWCFNPDGSLKKDYKVLHTMGEVREAVEEIEMMRNVVVAKNPKMDFPVAVDCETTGLNINSLPWYNEDGEKNPLKSEIGGMSLTWKDDQGVYIPFLHTKFQNVPREECLNYLRPYLQKWYLETHNGLFDGKVYLDNKIELNIRDDSMIMLFNINPTVAKGSKGLKENTKRRYGHEVLDHDDVFPSKQDVTSYYDLPEEIVKIYACADSDYTHKLCRDLRKEIPSMAPYALDMRVMRYLIHVNYNGNRVDEKLLNRLSSVVEKDLHTVEELMFKFVGQISQLTQFEKVMDRALKSGTTNEEEVKRLREELVETEEFKSARYEFGPSKSDVLVDILYNKLNYPQVRVNKTTGRPTADKFALKDLAKEEVSADDIGSWLKYDVLSATADLGDSSLSYEDNILISASKFNKMKYPFVLLLQKWKELEKLRTTFFAWFLNESCDNMYYSDFSMTNAETSRIIGRIQTLKGAMKQLVIPYSDEYYLMGVDFSQIEARLMAFLAQDWDLVERLCNPRADYHVESAAVLKGKKPWEITKSERGDLKSVNFAVPYGMAEYSLAENLYGRPVTSDKVEKARVLLSQWKYTNWRIQVLLDTHREFASKRRPTKFWNEETGKIEIMNMRYVVNKYQRRRYFESGKYSGENLDRKTLASIDRMAGNYPIQSYAAEIFKTAFCNICRRLKKDGLFDKVKITALVHDEFLFNVHRSVDKYRVYEIIWEEMVQSISLPYKDSDGKWMKNEDGAYVLDKEHPVKFFFAGISIGPEWHDIHSNDAHETPNEYLMYIVDKIKDGTLEFKDYESGDVTSENFEETKAFMRELFISECKKLQPDFNTDNIKLYKIVPAFFDYFLKGKLKIYGDKPIREYNGDTDEISARLEVLIMNELSVDELKCIDEDGGNIRVVTRDANTVTDELAVEELELSKAEDDSIFDLFNDEDLDNFEDEDDDDFNISIPIGRLEQKKEEDFKVLSKRTDPNDKRSIWDLVDFGKKVNTYDAKEIRKIMVRSSTVVINITGCDVGHVRALCRYLYAKDKKDGKFKVTLQNNETLKDCGIQVDDIDKEEVSKIMDWSLFD